LKEEVESLDMVRVFFYQFEGYDNLPLAVGTFDVVQGGFLSLKE
jgi:hypothetical protein